MKALIRKELLEVGTLAGLALLALVAIWLGSASFTEVVVEPREWPLLFVLGTAGYGGIVLSFFQFSRERRTGTLSYAIHRGTGAGGLFLAKVATGLAATALVSIGPPVVFALHRSVFRSSEVVVQWARIGEMAHLAVLGATTYAVGVLCSQLRRGLLLDLAMVLVTAGGCLLIGVVALRSQEPWSVRLWHFTLLEATLAIFAICIARLFFLRSADRDLPLTRGAHLALLAFATATVIPALAALAMLAQDRARRELDAISATIYMDNSSGEFVAGKRDANTVMRRTDNGAVIDEQLTRMVPAGSSTEMRTSGSMVRACGPHWGASSSPGESVRPASDGVISSQFPPRWGLLDWPGLNCYSTSRGDFTVFAFLDPEEGVVRVFSYSWPWLHGGVAIAEDRLPPELPFALALQKPGGAGRFSRLTKIMRAFDSRKWMFTDNGAAGYTESQSPSCLIDIEDGTLWKMDPLDLRAPLRAVELPNGDHYVGIEQMYDATSLRFGRLYERAWPLVRGEHGIYHWNGSEMVVREPDSKSTILESEAAAHIEMRVTATDSDVLTPAVEIRDAKDDRLLFSYRFSPDTAREKTFAALIQACTLLRPPVLNVVSFAQGSRASASALLAGFDEPLLSGHARPGLLAASVLVGLASLIAAWRRLRARGASTALTVVSAAIAGLFGPLAFALVWALEPRRATQLASEPRGSEERALLIESA